MLLRVAMFVLLVAVSAVVHACDNSDYCGVSPAITKYGSTLKASAKSMARIQGGHPSVVKDWPFLVHLKICDKTCSQCTGFLIDKRTIVTASHCSDRYGNKTKIFASFGFIGYGTPAKKVLEATVVFSSKEYYDDVGILQLVEDVEFDEYISPLCLNRDIQQSIGENTISIGYGKLLNAQNTIVDSEGLREAITPIRKCTFLVDNNICAGKFGSTAMSGDSGGPLVGIRNGKFYLHGVTRGPSTPRKPNNWNEEEFYIEFYTKVSKVCKHLETHTNYKCERN